MRRLAARPTLPPATESKLREKTAEILAVPTGATRSDRARSAFKAARDTGWFAPIVSGLRGLCGEGELCMYCSSNEPSQVEHFRPLSIFPESAFAYTNYLWACDICNRSYKGERFPPDTETGAPILNPLDDDVWSHFFIDFQFGRLLCRVDPATGGRLPRAVSTCDVVGIDRDNVQTKRQRRFQNLLRAANRALTEVQAGTLDLAGLKLEIEQWRTEPFQADVPDYFLNGPGRSKEPFRSVLSLAGENVP